jgi:hypothetical protein
VSAPESAAVTPGQAAKPKYLVFRTDGTDIPEDEPCWVFRAKDALALAAIVAYRAMAEGVALPPEFLADIDAHIDRIRSWQERHGAKMPD